ncbi:Ribosome biogenesis protein Nop16 [Friedmanniomyces endolithicus]|uniref:Nucleolar protein 16 n=1 Tax=Friedmanniomyces endolithicus TaxID=329885 RepID=A0AAN6QNS1_9PEZI|nr:Ribosome biogenesis protein Nop16 [Friedmanniomyces endolithicus]KAK0975943.1 Ribosome biogenesis protein Nop16 [Friedmanniomyces endolithicus]KAK0979258.1 Ribosome biogenesis protein Nop16 [Friedmanniomyces endolithicus]
MAVKHIETISNAKNAFRAGTSAELVGPRYLFTLPRPPPSVPSINVLDPVHSKQIIADMGRELQKKKNRSGVSKAVRKPRSKKLHLQNPIISANWDKTQTLEQNYKRLGLTSKLNKNTGGVERKAEDVQRARDEAAGESVKQKDDVLAIGAMRRPREIQVQEARIERDPETGRILRVIGDGQGRANPLNDPLNELDSEDDDEMGDGMGQHASHITAYAAGDDTRTEVVRRLEFEASRPKATHKPMQSENERAFVVELVAKYGDDYGAMTRDMKINYMQRSAGDLKRRVKKWRESGGMVA